ncbi:MAG: hypothetical protein ABR602_00205 [Gemmatimonadales bacterium]
MGSLVKTVDVNGEGLDGMTALMLAMRQLPKTPAQQEVLRLGKRCPSPGTPAIGPLLDSPRSTRRSEWLSLLLRLRLIRRHLTLELHAP